MRSSDSQQERDETQSQRHGRALGSKVGEGTTCFPLREAGSLVGCSPWGHRESDVAGRLQFHFYALEKEMATHSSVLAWRIPGTAEPGGLLSVGSHGVGHD